MLNKLTQGIIVIKEWDVENTENFQKNKEGICGYMSSKIRPFSTNMQHVSAKVLCCKENYHGNGIWNKNLVCK